MRRPARSSWPRWSCSTRASSTRSSRSARRAGRSGNPDKVAASTTAKEADAYAAAVDARRGRRAADADPPPRPRDHPPTRPVDHHRRARRRRRSSRSRPAASASWPTRPRGRSSAPSRRPSTSTSMRRCTRPRMRELSLAQFQPVEYGEELEVAPGIHATFVDAGHILGSAIIRLRVQDHDGGEERVIVFSGDLGRPGTPILRDPTADDRRRLRPVESTYGGREHEPEDEAIRILAETVRHGRRAPRRPPGAVVRHRADAGDRLGARPAHRAWRDPAPAALPRLADGLQGVRHLPPPSRLLRRGDRASSCARARTPLDYPNQIVTNDVKESQAIARAPRPYMIVASNGMLTGGRVVGHLRNLIDDPTAMILFVGYQGEGTLGSHLQAGAKTVKLDGQVRQVRCQIRSISGFSAHADESELLAWLGGFAAGKRPGDPGYPRTRVPRPRRSRTRRSPSNRRCATWASPPMSRTGTSGSRSTDDRPRNRPGGSVRTSGEPTHPLEDPPDALEPPPHGARHRPDRRSRRLLECGRQQRPCGLGGPTAAPSVAPSAARPRLRPRSRARPPHRRRRARPSRSPIRRSARRSSSTAKTVMTLYMFTPDAGQTCAVLLRDWAISTGPPYRGPPATVGAGLDASKLRPSARADGLGTRSEVRRLPLYTSPMTRRPATPTARASDRASGSSSVRTASRSSSSPRPVARDRSSDGGSPWGSPLSFHVGGFGRDRVPPGPGPRGPQPIHPSHCASARVAHRPQVDARPSPQKMRVASR